MSTTDGPDAVNLYEKLETVPLLKGLQRDLRGTFSGVPSGAVMLLAQWLRTATRRDVIVVGEDAEQLYLDAVVWSEENVGLFAPPDTPAFDTIAPSDEVTTRRLHSLELLASDAPALVITTPVALMRPTVSEGFLSKFRVEIRAGETLNRDDVVRKFVAMGYRKTSAVSVVGDFSVRGGIVDVFPPSERRPVRIEWFGNDVDEIRAFEVESQTSAGKRKEISVGPARELDMSDAAISHALASVTKLDMSACRPEIREQWAARQDLLGAGGYDEQLDVFFPYLMDRDPATLFSHAHDAIWVIAGDRERLMRTAVRYSEEMTSLFDQEIDRGELPAGASMGVRPLSEIEQPLATAIELVRESVGASSGHDLGWLGATTYASRLDALSAHVRAEEAQGRTVIALTRQPERVEEITAESGIAHVALDELGLPGEDVPAGFVVARGELSSGFLAPAIGLEVITDVELFGHTKRRGSPLARHGRKVLSTSARGARRAASGKAAAKAFTMPFAPGDLVVHRDHGIGRFVEMRKQLDGGAEHEYMTIEYAHGDRLYVPVAHLDRVDRYVGGSDSAPMLSKLGTGEWERTKKRVKERAEAIARELLGLYSRRELASGTAYSPDGNWMHELEESFPFVETPDQVVVIDEIKRDMEASKPMDRVVCGDVGFGKTEIAVRAAFKAICDGKQVAVLVPTTVLSQQHFETFAERLSPFPVEVAQLSRFCSEDDIRKTIIGLRSGAVDVVVGTHRLIQKDIVFKNLGLVIIDEEQRFGVMQKEKFKELRAGVDVLSLSATPIPRTLHMSLAGIRDLSVIQSPPEARQPIKTYVTAREDSLVKEVIDRELARGGQVFFVHNRVRSIEHEADKIRELVPNARVAIGHGQMDEKLLAGVMHSFSEGDVDVLVCTTIVESGLDIPNANTIIINDAHRFGLAQLYQLRGRVGRSGHRAYAYILYPPERSLTEKADKRLEVIGELQDLGAGFTLAMRDLEIRGAGNLLGEEQSGEIVAVGLELYNHLLNQAVSALQGTPLQESPAQVSVSLPTPAFLPPAYVTDEKLRLRCYQDLAACVTEAELESAARGLRDRFGPLPTEAEGLIFSLRVRLLAAAAGVGAVETDDRGGVTIQLPLRHGLDLEAVNRQFPKWLSRSPSRLYLAPANGKTEEWSDVLLRSLKELGRLSRVQTGEVAHA